MRLPGSPPKPLRAPLLGVKMGAHEEENFPCATAINGF